MTEDAKPQATAAAFDKLRARARQLERELQELKTNAPPAPSMTVVVQEEDAKEIADYLN